MSLKDRLKEEVRMERQKMKEMSLQDKIWYIWEYYKLHIGGILIAVLVISVVITSVRNASIDPGLYCVIINNHSAEELDTSVLEQDFFEYMEFGKKQPVYVESMYIAYGDAATEYSYASMAKISALVASRDLDVLITDEENIDHYTQLDGLADLEKVLPEDLLSSVEERLRYTSNSAGRSMATSLDISGTWLADRMRLSEDASNLSMFVNTEQTEIVFALIRYIFDL